MISIQLLIISTLLIITNAAFASPTWSANPMLNSGQHKAVNNIMKTPSTFTAPQTFSVAFAAAPRVVLSLQGYKQNAPCASCPVGFKVSIASVTASNFVSSVTVYGANIFYLFFMYLGISNSAVLYSTDYQLYTFSSGNLTDVGSPSRIHTQVNNNVAGQSYPNYLTHTISNIIYLAGYKMNLGTTGTYINLTSSVVSSSTHSITIATINDVQILEVCYFRLSFDKTVVMQGYASVIDQWSFYGINNTQYQYTTTLVSTALQYRNYLMGISYIHIASTSTVTDFMLAFNVITPTWQLIWTSASASYVFNNPTFAYLQGEVFHNRVRTCPVGTPYFLYTTQICYDVCIDRTYGVTDISQYCELCHYSCLTCNGKLNNNCLTCSAAADFRVKNNTDSTCVCLDGYYENSVQVCPSCATTCLTCQTSASYCLSCSAGSQHRVLNSTTHRCECDVGYYETALNTPAICLTCEYKCLTCQVQPTNCTSCDGAAHRAMDAGTATCPCVVGYYEDTVSNTGCKPCTIPGCQSCQLQSVSNQQSCSQCDATLNFTLTAVPSSSPARSTCSCIASNYYNSSLNSCVLCNYRCISCTDSLSCDSCSAGTHFRHIDLTVSPYCSCIDGFYQLANQPICQSCDTKCLTCVSSATNCLTCQAATRYRALSADGLTYTCTCNAGTQESTSTYGQCIPIPPPTPRAICGNAIVQSPEECDDGNTLSHDGCSSQCKIEQYHTCATYSNGNGTSLCFYNRPLQMQIESVLKELNSNKISIVIKIQALMCNLKSLKNYLDSLFAVQLSPARRLLYEKNGFNGRLLSSSIIFISSASYTMYDQAAYVGYLTLVLDYTQSISTLRNKKLMFLSSGSENTGSAQNYFFATPTSNIVLEDPHNNIPMIFYQASSYSLSTSLSYVFLAVNGLIWLFFIISLFVGKSVIAMQTMLVYQFAYFCVVGQQEVELAIASLAYFGRYSTGINVNIIQTQVSDRVVLFICPKMGKIYQQCNAIDNINVTFFIATAALITSIIILSYKARQQRLLDQLPVSDRESAVESVHRDNKNNEQNNIEYFNEMSEAKSVVTLTYELPPKISSLLCFCLELTFGLYFMTAIEYLLTALNQNDQARIASIAWLGSVGFLFVTMWVIWFYFYPIAEISYIKVLRLGIERLSLVKFAYLYMFVFLVILGAILSAAPGIASYILLILFSLSWLFLTVRKSLYGSRYNKIRSIINQIIIIAIAVIYIMLQYVVKDGLGVAFSVILLILLILCLLSNVAFFICDMRIEKQHQQLMKDDQKMNQMAIQFAKYSSRSGERNCTPTPNTALTKIPILEQYDITSPQKEPLMDPTELKQLAKNKMKELKSFRQQLKLGNSGRIADEKKVEMLSALRKIDNQDISQISVSKEYSNL